MDLNGLTELTFRHPISLAMRADEPLSMLQKPMHVNQAAFDDLHGLHDKLTLYMTDVGAIEAARAK